MIKAHLLDKDFEKTIFEFLPVFLEDVEKNSENPEAANKYRKIILDTCLEHLREFVKLDNVKGIRLVILF